MRASEGRALFGGGPGASSGENPDEDSFEAAGGWGIVLLSLPGEPSSEDINEARQIAQRSLARSDVRVLRQKSGAAIVLGSYEGPGSAAAKRDLAMVRERVVNGRRIYARAFMAPPPRTVDYGSRPEFNLSTVKARFGREALWTFQIGVYESPDRREAKAAAERAVVELRQQGEQAFYYHGASRSMVTIGVFGTDDYDEQGGPKNPQLFALIEKYPYNSLNGRRIIEKRPGQPDREQRSLLVRIPE